MLAAMADESMYCLVEIPKGSRNKYEWDAELGGIKLARFLFSSVVYPADYGFVRETVALDGEPLDAIVLVAEPTFPGCVIAVRTVGVLRTEDEGGQDDKLLCVPVSDPNWDRVERLSDVNELTRSEIEHFFAIYKVPEGHEVTIQGWEDREVASELVTDARERYVHAR
jgi:inorganic pyrophosphatase